MTASHTGRMAGKSVANQEEILKLRRLVFEEKGIATIDLAYVRSDIIQKLIETEFREQVGMLENFERTTRQTPPNGQMDRKHGH